MPVLVREPDHLVLDGGTITGPLAFDFPSEQRGPVQAFADDPMRVFVGVGHVAIDLVRREIFSAERKRSRVFVAFLLCKLFKINRLARKPGWGTGFQPLQLEAVIGQAST